MQIHYYEVPGCDFVIHEGKPVIIAPSGTAEASLREQGFQQDKNGKWYKFLNEKEYHDVMIGYPDNDVTFTDKDYPPQYAPCPEEKSKDKFSNSPIVLSIVFLILIIGAIALPANFEWMGIWSSGLWIAGLLLIVFFRVKYPANPLGTALMIIYLVLVLMIVSILILVMVQLGTLFLNFLTCNWSAC
ncbi:MAG: hypothetical protein IJ644_02665 [Oscillospiraceae bacterium]|nr:hypothetical protein [Oscillospiraceae bacterium]